MFDMARAFARDRLAPVARDLEEAGTIPRSLLREAGGLGLGGLFVAGEFGGAGPFPARRHLRVRGPGRRDVPRVAAYVSIHNMCAAMIDQYGSPAQRARWLPGLVTLDLVAAYCLTEPGSGSDAAALLTSARDDGDALRAQRHQELHLRRRTGRSLSRHGAHRRGGPARDLVHRRRGRNSRPRIRCAGREDGMAGTTHSRRDHGRVPRRVPATYLGEAGAGFPPGDGRSRRRPSQHRRRLPWRGPGGP